MCYVQRLAFVGFCKELPKSVIKSASPKPSCSISLPQLLYNLPVSTQKVSRLERIHTTLRLAPLRSHHRLHVLRATAIPNAAVAISLHQKRTSWTSTHSSSSHLDTSLFSQTHFNARHENQWRTRSPLLCVVQHASSYEHGLTPSISPIRSLTMVQECARLAVSRGFLPRSRWNALI